MTSAIQQWAGFYQQSLGLSPIPLTPKTKECHIPGYLQKDFGTDAFVVDSNLGLRSVNGVVVLDDDTIKRGPSWARIGDALLLKTPARWGRHSAPGSKFLYVCPTLTETRTWKDLTDAHILQLRVGLQDMAPPSIHPEGERLQWCGPLWHGMLQPIPAEQLVHACNLRATAVLIALAWPLHGRRLLVLAYSRFLLETIGLSAEDAERVLITAAFLGGSTDDGVRSIRGKVLDTKHALAKNEKAIGATYIRKTYPGWGPALLRRLREWFGKTSDVEEAIERLNDRFAIVSVGNKVVVMDNLPNGSIKKLWPFEEFKKLLSKERITIQSTTPTGKPTQKEVSLSDIWIKHPAGRRYESLVYDMPGSAERCCAEDYNGYLGFTVKPKEGDWSKNRDHLHKIICGGNTSLYEWLFNWMASLVKFPGRHAFTAIVLRGGEGVGKGHFAHLMLGALFHPQQYLHIIGAGMLTGQFNEHLSGKVLVFADESTWGGDPKAADKLKGMVTEATVPIERKFLPLVEEPSALHIVIASNNEWPVAIPKDDRRFVVFDVLDDQRQMESYFTPLREELRNGGLAAMLFDLQQHEVCESDLRHPPTTRGKREVMLQSLKPIERWWYEKLVRGTMTVTKIIKSGNTFTTVTVDEWPTSITKSTLHEDYLSFLDKHRETRARRSTETELGMFLNKYTPMQGSRELLPGTEGDKKQQYVWHLPSLKECRDHWAGECGWNGWQEDEC